MQARKINLAEFGPSKIRNMIASTWMRHYKLFFALYAIAILGWGVWVWYDSFYGTMWTQEQKEAYMNSKDTSIAFREQDFRKVLAEIEKRNQKHAQSIGEVNDVFK